MINNIPNANVKYIDLILYNATFTSYVDYLDGLWVISPLVHLRWNWGILVSPLCPLSIHPSVSGSGWQYICWSKNESNCVDPISTVLASTGMLWWDIWLTNIYIYQILWKHFALTIIVIKGLLWWCLVNIYSTNSFSTATNGGLVNFPSHSMTKMQWGSSWILHISKWSIFPLEMKWK